MLTKFINTATRATWNHSVALAGHTKQLSNSTLTFKARIYMDCYICGKEYTTWEGLFYHKRKFYNCTNFRSSRYEYEIKKATNLAEEKVCKCMFCPQRFRKETMEDHYWKTHKENFTWIKCKLGCSEVREEMFNDHIKEHNVYSKNDYYMKTEKLKDLLNTEHYDVILVALKELAEKRRETDHKIFKSMDSRPRIFERCPFSVVIIGCR